MCINCMYCVKTPIEIHSLRITLVYEFQCILSHYLVHVKQFKPPSNMAAWLHAQFKGFTAPHVFRRAIPTTYEDDKRRACLQEKEDLVQRVERAYNERCPWNSSRNNVDTVLQEAHSEMHQRCCCFHQELTDASASPDALTQRKTGCEVDVVVTGRRCRRRRQMDSYSALTARLAAVQGPAAEAAGPSSCWSNRHDPPRSKSHRRRSLQHSHRRRYSLPGSFFANAGPLALAGMQFPAGFHSDCDQLLLRRCHQLFKSSFVYKSIQSLVQHHNKQFSAVKH